MFNTAHKTAHEKEHAKTATNAFKKDDTNTEMNNSEQFLSAVSVRVDALLKR